MNEETALRVLERQLNHDSHGIAPPAAPLPYLNTPKAAEFLGVSPRTLEDWRLRGGGPAFRKFGKLVRYRFTDLVAYGERVRLVNTSGAVAA